LIVDTGATKSVLFEEVLGERVPGSRSWRSLRGLSAPTLFGSSRARVVLIPTLELPLAEGGRNRPDHPPTRTLRSGSGPFLTVRDLDAVVIRNELSQALSAAVHRPVDGLLGYSFLKRYRVAFDYPHRVLWL